MGTIEVLNKSPHLTRERLALMRAGKVKAVKIEPSRHSGQCFYCGEYMQRGGQMMSKTETVDHIVPQRQLKRTPGASELPAFWYAANRVLSCAACNNYKGQLEPLDWLVIMPSHEGAERLAKRLFELGYQMAEVVAAMSRRKK